jgi:ferrous iron transport protein B
MGTPFAMPAVDPPEVQPATAPRATSEGAGRLVVLTGNPNCGKTTLFNVLTGLRARVGNYAGVTVERKEGRLLGATRPPVTVLDLPGAYSLSPQSLDEQIARDVLFHRLAEVPVPTMVVVVVDASNLERNLYYTTQVIELGYPTAIALNMVDVAAQNGQTVDADRLAQQLGVPVFPMVASTREGIPALRDHLLAATRDTVPPASGPRFGELPEPFAREAADVAGWLLKRFPERPWLAPAVSVIVLGDEKNLRDNAIYYGAEFTAAVQAARQRLEAAGVEWRSAAIEARYGCVAAIQQAVVTESGALQETFSDRLDRVLTHRFWGVLIFVAVMALMFQSIFTFARLPMAALQTGVGWIGEAVGRFIPPGDLHSLLVDGVIAGVGAVVVFLPQICLLFLFIGLLEDSGYMARAAFLMDRLMSKVGLHGKSFIPMLSSFACAIPGIMATRTIESPKDRLVTILVAPLMSCSARLPVYTLLIAACIPNVTVLGFLELPGLTMLGMYLLGIIVALLMAWWFKKTLLKGQTPMLIMELPPYKRPVPTVLLRHMWDRAKLFLRRAGTVILGINILLWFLATYPRSSEQETRFAARQVAAARSVYPNIANEAGLRQKIHEAEQLRRHEDSPGATATLPPDRDQLVKLDGQMVELEKAFAGEKLRQSFAGQLGKLIEPVIAPLGFDWKIGIGIVASFAAREVFVSTMSVVYNVADSGETNGAAPALVRTLREQRRPDGTPVYTTLTAVTLMVFYVLALQCASTVAVVRRETNTWKWPLFQWAYMGALAWTLAFLVRIGGGWLGYH